MRHAELLVAAVDDGLSGRRGMVGALADYQRRRDASAMPMYEFTSQLATLEPPSARMAELLASLQGDSAGIERFFGVFAGSVPVEEFFGAPPAAEVA